MATDDEEDEDHDDVCHRLNTGAALNHDTESSTASTNGNGSLSALRGLFTAARNGRDTAAVSAEETPIPVNGAATAAENPAFHEQPASAPPSLLGRMLTREEELAGNSN